MKWSYRHYKGSARTWFDPGDPDETTIETAECEKSGNQVELTDDEEERAISKAIDDHREDQQDAMAQRRDNYDTNQPF